MEEMDAASFCEWVAFDSIEPLDAAGAILQGLSSSGKGEDQAPPAGPAWMQQKVDMMKWFNLFGKKKP
jgi:hypothetical protein